MPSAERLARMTPEQREEHRKQCREWHARRTPELRSRKKRRDQKQNRQWYARLSPLQRARRVMRWGIHRREARAEVLRGLP